MSARQCTSCGQVFDYQDGTDPIWCGRCNKKTVDPRARIVESHSDWCLQWHGMKCNCGAAEGVPIDKRTRPNQPAPMNPPAPWLRPRPAAPAGPAVPDVEALERHAGEVAARENEQARDVRSQDHEVRRLTCGCCTAGCICRIHMDVPRGVRPQLCAVHGGPRFLEV